MCNIYNQYRPITIPLTITLAQLDCFRIWMVKRKKIRQLQGALTKFGWVEQGEVNTIPLQDFAQFCIFCTAAQLCRQKQNRPCCCGADKCIFFPASKPQTFSLWGKSEKFCYVGPWPVWFLSNAACPLKHTGGWKVVTPLELGYELIQNPHSVPALKLVQSISSSHIGPTFKERQLFVVSLPSRISFKRLFLCFMPERAALPGLASAYRCLFLRDQVVDISFIFLTRGLPFTGLSKVVANYDKT